MQMALLKRKAPGAVDTQRGGSFYLRAVALGHDDLTAMLWAVREREDI